MNITELQAQELLRAIVVQAFRDGLLENAYSERERHNVIRITFEGERFLFKCASDLFTVKAEELPEVYGDSLPLLDEERP